MSGDRQERKKEIVVESQTRTVSGLSLDKEGKRLLNKLDGLLKMSGELFDPQMPESLLPNAILEPATVLGNYRLIKPLAERNGFSAYMAECKATQCRVLVKLAYTRAAFYQPMHECRLLINQLSGCPFVPRVLDAGFDSDAQCFVFVQTPLGRDLRIMFELLQDVLDGDAPIFRKCFLDTMGPKASAALASIHALGIVHRDIKPSNIIEHQGTIQFIDFGASTANASVPQVLISSAYASAAVRGGMPGSVEDDWISLAYSWYAISLGKFDLYEAQVTTETRPSIRDLAVMFPYFAPNLLGKVVLDVSVVHPASVLPLQAYSSPRKQETKIDKQSLKMPDDDAQHTEALTKSSQDDQHAQQTETLAKLQRDKTMSVVSHN